MGLFFTGKELVNIAVGIEKNGAAFYDAAQATAKTDEARKTLKYLADSEREHIKRFKDMLISVQEIQPSDIYTEEYGMYLKSLVESAVFSNDQQAKDMASNLNNTEEVLQIALAAEKESILFYSAIKELVKRSEQELVAKIIDEEKSHISLLLKLKNG